MNTAEVLERAADIMQARGKACEAYIDGDGSVCVVGACALASGIPADSDEIAQWWRSKFGDADPTSWVRRAFGNVTGWSDGNDAPTVIAGLRAVAAVERAKSRMLPVVTEQVPA